MLKNLAVDRETFPSASGAEFCVSAPQITALNCWVFDHESPTNMVITDRKVDMKEVSMVSCCAERSEEHF